jgi:pimeloyl-ACP methyl ester carboxylesterase
MTPHDLVKSYYAGRKEDLQMSKSTADSAMLKKKLAGDLEQLMGFRPARTTPAVEELSQREAGSLRINHFVFSPEEGIQLPAVWLEGVDGSDGDLILYLHEEGKSALVRDSEIVGVLLDRGCRILAVDLRGTGETAPGKEGYFWDFLAGRPISGQRVGDVLSVLSWVEKLGVDLEDVRIWGQGLMGLWAAMASLYPRPVGGMVLEDVLISFEDVILRQLPQYNHEILIPGIVNRFDLPDLYGALCPTSLTLLNPLLADKTPASSQDIEHAFSRTAETYSNFGTPNAFSVRTGFKGSTRVGVIVEKLLAP